MEENKSMIIEAKFTAAGMTRGKRYDVIDLINDRYYKIVLDGGIIGIRHRCNFNIVK